MLYRSVARGIGANFLQLEISLPCFLEEPTLPRSGSDYLFIVSTSVNACDGKNYLEANGDGGEGQLDHLPGINPLRAKFPGKGWERWCQFIWNLRV